MPTATSPLIKSRARVRDLAEVYTADREVQAMLDLVSDYASDPTKRFLEPACGNGNFLVAILDRKLATVRAMLTRNSRQPDFEFDTLVAVSSVYGIDICEDNVAEARARMRAVVVGHYSNSRNTWAQTEGFYTSVEHILSTNIVRGDSLNGAAEIVFVEYTVPRRHRFAQLHYTLADLELAASFGSRPTPVCVVGARRYQEVAA
jgi:hypothetical protein